ncbi:hypothetical protein ONE63_008746 [Megalurothrips usitatus]|uniref:Mab-21-like HhH/H2TH-like domain-containing protein n=1 Tax=Megalurothrips usitatus TaxID=439358 RepID=A0AAV7XM48_9NEOP|nr:hypothetical protein ONE63_008746 [Megalurothrips usitatus]
MARYVLKLPPLPQMGYYQDPGGAAAVTRPFHHPVQSLSQPRSSSLGPAGSGRPPQAMGCAGGGGGGGGGGSSEEDGAATGCLEGLRRHHRGPRAGRRGGAGTDTGTLLLQHDAIKFTGPQLSRADAVLGDIIRDDMPMQGDRAPGVEAVCERLVQRLLCAVGTADPRFASKYLVCLDRRVSGESDSLTLEYLVRLDALSSPTLYPGDPDPPCRVVEGAAQEAVPQGYARLRVHGQGHEQWSEFLSPAGFIRRDKVQERFVELLAAAAAPVSSPAVRPAKPPAGGVALPTPAPRGPRGPHSPLQVDESRLCGAPGKVVDAAVLADLLALPADAQLFLATGTDRYPDPREARIAIVEGSPWVRLRLGLTRDVLVKLVLGVGVDRWPRGSDLPARVPLTHPDCLLYQHIATTGCFLVASGPPPLLRCDDRPCTWQALRQLLLWRLETDDGEADGEDRGHAERMRRWLPATAPLHAVAVLDRLVCVLRGATERCYLFPSLHLLSASARQGVLLSEEALLGDAAALAAFLRRLHIDCSLAPMTLPKGVGGIGVDARPRRDSGPPCWPGEEAASDDCWSRLEEALLPAWTTAIKDSAPPAANRSRRLGFRVSSGGGPTAEAAHFTPRQLQYIGALLRGLLQCRAVRIEGPSTHSWFPGTMRRHPFAAADDKKLPRQDVDGGVWPDGPDAAVTADAEDVACLVAVVLEQARTHALWVSELGNGLAPPRRRRPDDTDRPCACFSGGARTAGGAAARPAPARTPGGRGHGAPPAAARAAAARRPPRREAAAEAGAAPTASSGGGTTRPSTSCCRR